MNPAQNEEKGNRKESPKEDWILIPFHSRLDLLEELLRNLSSYQILVIDSSDDLLSEVKYAKNVFVLKNMERKSFANSVNIGLDFLEGKGIKRSLILNDDAKIREEDCAQLFEEWGEKQLISPIIHQNGDCFHGIRVKNWGRVFLDSTTKQPDSLLGTCLLIPTELRFDTGFPHGFEDIELCLRAKKQGYKLRVLDSVICWHLGEGSLSRKERQGQRFSTYGHLRLFSSKRKAPSIGMLSLLQILKERGDSERYLGWAQGVGDWLAEDCRSFAARIAPSSSGSSNTR